MGFHLGLGQVNVHGSWMYSGYSVEGLSWGGWVALHFQVTWLKVHSRPIEW